MTISETITIRPSSGPSYCDCALRTIAKTYPFLLREAGYEPRQLPSSVGAAVGSGVHRAGEYSLKLKMQTGHDIGTDDDAVDAAIAEFDDRIEEGVIWDDTTPTRDAAQKQIDVMSKLYRSRIVPKLDPVMIEERIELEYAPGYIISGQPDVVTSGLRDTKTGVIRRANGVQYGNYCALLKSRRVPVASITEDYIRRVPLSKTQPEPESHAYDVNTCILAAKATNDRIVNDINRFIRTGDLNTFIANPASMMCSDKYCPAHGTDICKLHKKD